MKQGLADELADELASHLGVAVLEEGGELGVEIRGLVDVSEHGVELLGEQVPADLAQPEDHGRLQVHGATLHEDQSTSQGMPVELLEDVLVIQVDEDADAALQLVIYIRLGESLTGLSQ